MSNKRRRTSQWSTISKLYNAGSLAERLDEQEELVAVKEKRIAVLQELLAQKKSESFETASEWEAHCSKLTQSLSRIRAERDELRRKHEHAIARKDSEFLELKRAFAALQERLEEQQEETQQYKERLEDLQQKGAAALAAQTIAKFGVTPEEVLKFKDFAEKQAHAAAAQQALAMAAQKAITPSLTDL